MKRSQRDSLTSLELSMSDRSAHLDAPSMAPWGVFLPDLAARNLRAAFFRINKVPVDLQDSAGLKRKKRVERC